MPNASKRVMFVPDGGGAPIVGTLVELPPLQIWGPTDPRPGWGLPGDQPGVWPGPGPLPGIEHPIALPGDPWFPDPIEPPGGETPPDAPPQHCKWTYTEEGWFLICGPTDKPRPPGK